MENIWILAQAQTTGPAEISSEPVSTESQAVTTVPAEPNAGAAKAPPGGPFGSYGTLMFLVLMFVLFYFMLFRGPRKQKQQHQKMVQSLNKNDRVRTIGGIIGTVVDIKGDEITLKIDESNNTKMKVASSAIGKNLSSEG